MRPTTLLAGLTFLTVLFVVGPLAMVWLNAALGWPRWEAEAGRLLGALLILAGVGVLLYCSRLFSTVGRGTPVPLQPPERLVVVGLYHYSRNPIYVADVAILLGLFLRRGELALLCYAVLLTGLVHLLIVRREEPELRDRFGEEYARYAERVPRWIGLPRSGTRDPSPH